MRYIKFLKIGVVALTLVSCATHMHSGDYISKYQEAVARYQAKDYYEALQLFKEVIPMLKGRREIIPAQFYQAYAFFYEKSYKMSARCFASFYKTFPRLEQAEEALYMQGYSLYLNVPDVRLDQTQTEKALKILQLYLDNYPTGVYQQQALQYCETLQAKLTLKAFNSAKLYYQIGYYQAAVIALEKFQEEYAQSSHHEEAFYLKIEAQYKLAKNKGLKDQLVRLLAVIDHYHKFLDSYPNSRYAKELEKLYNISLEKIDKFAIHKNQSL